MMSEPLTLLAEIDALCERHGIGFDEFLEAIGSELFGRAQTIDDALVRSCVEACASGLMEAGMDFYVSTK
jgi:hypothetical protein